MFAARRFRSKDWKRSSDAESARRLSPHPGRSLDKAPAQILGLFFTYSRSTVAHFSGHFLYMHCTMNAAWLIAFSTAATFAGLGLSESSSFNFLAHNNVAAKRIAYFGSSFMGVSRRWVAGRGGNLVVRPALMS